MNLTFTLFFNSILLGIGLAMDAFSVSLANGLNEPYMKKSKMAGVAGVYGIFQGVMPLIGWVAVSTIANTFEAFQKFIPWIALILLGYIGGKMLYEGIKNRGEECVEGKVLGIGALMVQGIATSIDALSVGFTIADYSFIQAVVAALIIAVVTFAICIVGLALGKRAGTRLAGRANILGGAILIFIGLEIFIKSFL